MHVEGTLSAQPATQYRIEIFANSIGFAHSSGYGAGERYLGVVLVTTDASGNASFNANVTAAVAVGETVTATATDASGNTSEFGANHVIIGPTPILDLDADDSSGQTGADFIANYVEDGNPVNIADADAIAWDPDTSNLAYESKDELSRGKLTLVAFGGCPTTSDRGSKKPCTQQAAVTSAE